MTVRRLSVYTRCLQQLEEDGVKTISSQELAERFSLNSAQVRKDLAYFGEFGVRGIGYYVSERTKSEIYEATEPLLNGKKVVLLDVALLEQQLLGLVWRGGRTR